MPVSQLCPTRYDPTDYSPPGSFVLSPVLLCLLDFSSKKTRGLLFPTPEDLPDPGIESHSLASPAWQVDSLLPGHVGSSKYLKNVVKTVHCLHTLYDTENESESCSVVSDSL